MLASLLQSHPLLRTTHSPWKQINLHDAVAKFNKGSHRERDNRTTSWVNNLRISPLWPRVSLEHGYYLGIESSANNSHIRLHFLCMGMADTHLRFVSGTGVPL